MCFADVSNVAGSNATDPYSLADDETIRVAGQYDAMICNIVTYRTVSIGFVKSLSRYGSMGETQRRIGSDKIYLIQNRTAFKLIW